MPCLVTYLREICTCAARVLFRKMHNSIVYNSKKLKEPKCSQTVELLNLPWCIHPIELCSNENENE